VTVRTEAEPLTVRLEPCGVVVGRVVDREGKPVPGERVSFNPGILKGPNRSDDAGRFRVELVAGRQYTLVLRRERLSFAIEPGCTRDLGDLLVGDRPAGKGRAPGANGLRQAPAP
jgi:hypothetical protein